MLYIIFLVKPLLQLLRIMKKIKSIEELKNLREVVQKKIELREKSENPEQWIQIKIGMSSCGIAAGAKEVFNYFFNHLPENGIEAIITQTECMGHCKAEPTVEITKPGEAPVLFGNVTIERAEEIIQKYLKANEIVGDVL